MKWPNEKILLGKPAVEVDGDYQDLGNSATGFSCEDFLKDLRGNRKIAQARREVENTFEFYFEDISDKKFQLSFLGGFWNNYYINNKPSIVLRKSSGEFGVKHISMWFYAQSGLYSW